IFDKPRTVRLVISIDGNVYRSPGDIRNVTLLPPPVQHTCRTVVIKSIGEHSLLIISPGIPYFIAHTKLQQQIQIKVSITDNIGKSPYKFRLGIAYDGKVVIGDHAVSVNVPVIHVPALDAV